MASNTLLLRFPLHSSTKPRFPPTPSPVTTRFLHPLTPPLKPLPKTLTLPRCQTRTSNLSNRPPAPPIERVAAAVPYINPLLCCISYGVGLSMEYPMILRNAFVPLFPILHPFASPWYLKVSLLISVYTLVVGFSSGFGWNFGRYVGANAAQAALLNCVIGMVDYLFLKHGQAGLGYWMAVSHFMVCVFLVVCLVKSVWSCVLGRPSLLHSCADLPL